MAGKSKKGTITPMPFLVSRLWIFLLLLAAASADGSSNHRILGSADPMEISLDLETGAATLSIHNEPWFQLKGGMKVFGWKEPMTLCDTYRTNETRNYSSLLGPYTNITFVWHNQEDVVHTSVLVFSKRNAIIFEQTFVSGWENPLMMSTDETIPAIVAGFPSVDLDLPKDDLGFLWWGGCFAHQVQAGNWKDDKHSKRPTDWFDGNEHGQPWVVHDDDGNTVVLSSLDNFFVSGMEAQQPENDGSILAAGLRTTLQSIPPGHTHSTILVAGQHGINATLMEWGDLLLDLGDKERSKVYEDFALAHLGYWTDNGAYHYNGAKENDLYENMQDALLGVKEGMKQKEIPIRYIQWDDWWMEKNGDFPGMLSWTPKPDVFPSGFTDWLGMPLAMYAPGYSSDNVWRKDFSWKVDPVKKTSIPTDPNFYQALFKNGTSIGMVIFEQDFLCSLPWAIGSTSLTTTDVTTGKEWLYNMDRAAQDSGIHLQLCMADVYHILQATSLPSVTNARATSDNVRQVATIRSMGQSSLLFYATGIFASRDNVWTSEAHVEQLGCGNKDFCYEPNNHLDNAVAVLSGGPYGIADGLAYVNATVVLKSCRSDGLLLRPKWPMTSLDFTFTEADAKGSLVWAAHDDHGGIYRWSYVIGVDLKKVIAITPQRLLQGLPSPASGTMLAWEVTIDNQITDAFVFSDSSPFFLPISKPLDLPYDTDSPPHTHYATAPVMPNGMVLLGEISKWATMSFGRVADFVVDHDSLALRVVGAASEVVIFAFVRDVKEDGFKIENVKCSFPSSCSDIDRHGNAYCQKQLLCQKSTGCSCDSFLEDDLAGLRGRDASE